MTNKTEFNDHELSLYSRHILLPQVDVAGQLAFANARVLVFGLGGLGSPVAQYLASSGVGYLTLVDHDQVEVSNLQRQVIHNQKTLGMDKVASAAQAIAALNSQCQIHTINHILSSEELNEAVKAADVVVDCTDNFSSRININRACFQQGTPLVSGAAIRLEGQVIVFDFRQPNSPCYQCLYDVSNEEALSCAQSGVLAPLVGVIGSCQALEVLRLLAGFGQPAVGRLHIYDAMSGKWRELKLQRDPNCSNCATH